ncbi:MAG TPA: beta-galactosidase trimerization domain-containing protein, partial [Tepidisphaeraceae bacterium]|nr:beta-galactosidase trimerization domain-containing protein [Tepidisphaeraceae bacterium]
YLQADNKIGPLMSGAEWKHDGVAIYYSHPSIQLGWILDAQSQGKTWINRNGDHKLGASHAVRKAWENMLRDEGLQYNFISYADVIQNGIPDEYRVLILPACLALSDAEAKQIKAFCSNGGTVIADYLPAIWDQHGKGRSTGGLDDLFGVKHSPALSAKDLFGGGPLWTEVDQDANYSYKSYEQFLTNKNTCIKDATGFNKAVRDMGVIHTNHFGKGTAVLMNLSPQWYNAYRTEGAEAASRRSVFMNPIHQTGVNRWVKLQGDHTFGSEITYWKQGNRTILFVCENPEISVSSVGGGNSVGLKTDASAVTLKFDKPVAQARDERAGKDLGSGSEFKFNWKMNEAIVVSFTAK